MKKSTLQFVTTMAIMLSATMLQAQPGNDDCANATVVNGPFPQTVYGTNVDATVDCPDVFYDWGDVWYAITLPYESNYLTVDWCGTSNIDFVGGLIYTAYPFVCSDYVGYTSAHWQICGTPPEAATVFFNFFEIPGPAIVYYPAFTQPLMDHVITFNVTPSAPGDVIDSAFVIPSLPYYDDGTTAGYADDYDEACLFGGSTAPDVVYSYTPPGDVTIDIDLCGSWYDTKVFVYENTVTPGAPFACNNDYYEDDICGYGASYLGSVSLEGGNTYYIVVDGDEGSNDPYSISVSVPPPPNDDCANATVVNGPFPQTVSGTTVGATVDCPGVWDWNAVWYAITLPYESNYLTVDWCGSTNIDFVGGIIYTSYPFVCSDFIGYTSALWQICGTPPEEFSVFLNFFEIPGPVTVYYPAYTLPQRDHVITFNVTEGAPPGDVIGSAFVIPSLPYFDDGTTAGYADDYDEACLFGGSTAPDVVYSYTPPGDVTIDIDLCGSWYDTKVFVYENTVTPGAPFACNNDYYEDDICGYGASYLGSVSLEGGNTYYIVVDGDEGSNDPYSISVSFSCDITVNAGDDATTYFGIASMQEVTRAAVVTGGTPPYTYEWTLDRPLLCNQVNSTGDESFYGGTCANNTCPESGSPTENASCSGSEITAVLLEPATVCVTVTDANDCTATDCFTVTAADVRCFSGNGGNEKVKMCHHTNSQNNPWVEICVDPDVVNSHLAHGDYIGPCDFTKTVNPGVKPDPGLHFNLFPNPASRKVTVEFASGSGLTYIIEMSDLTGRKVISYYGDATMGENTLELNLGGIAPGIYLVTLILDGKKEMKKLVIE